MSAKPLLSVLNGTILPTPPLWMMRQAGRYLPEYRALRATCNGFLDLCYNPVKACEVTLQPIKRFGFDGAILFSDILVIPHALGQGVTFETGEGPRLYPLCDEALLRDLEKRLNWSILENVYETVSRVKAALPPSVTLLGFCGAPFTVASYMVAGKGGDEQAAVRLLAYRNPHFMQRLMGVLVEASVDYLEGQFKAGVDAVQIFDSWAGTLPYEEYQKWCLAPTLQIIQKLRARIPNAPVIYFPRGVHQGLSDLVSFGLNGIGLDWRADSRFACETLAPHMALQGTLDPLLLLAGGKALDEGVERILEAYKGVRHIFNLGHGITPPTPIEHVQQMIDRVRKGASSCNG